MTLFAPGPIPLAVLNPDGSKLKTLYLPSPDKKAPEVEWEKDSEIRKIPGVGERERIRGFLPIVTLRWGAYDDRAGQGYTIGMANGQRPTAEQLAQILSAASGTLKIGAGPGAGGFVVGVIKVSPVHLVGSTLAGGLQVTLRGRDYRPDMTLGVF